MCCDPLDGSRNIAASRWAASSASTAWRDFGWGGSVARCRGEVRVAAGGAHGGATVGARRRRRGGGGVRPRRRRLRHRQRRRSAALPAPGADIFPQRRRFDDWPEGLRGYVTDARQGENQTGKQYSARYVCSLVGDFHRTMKYGGWCGTRPPGSSRSRPSVRGENRGGKRRRTGRTGDGRQADPSALNGRRCSWAASTTGGGC